MKRSQQKNTLSAREVMLVLRDYQIDMFDKATDAFRNGAKGICCVLPCR
jgi:superfamily II DNA or RNA helicase